MPGRKSRGFGKALLVTFLVLLFLAGLAVFFYPTVNGLVTDYILRRDAEGFLSFVITDPQENTPQPSVAVPEQTKPAPDPPRKYPHLWDQMRAYNEAI